MSQVLRKFDVWLILHLPRSLAEERDMRSFLTNLPPLKLFFISLQRDLNFRLSIQVFPKLHHHQHTTECDRTTRDPQTTTLHQAAKDFYVMTRLYTSVFCSITISLKDKPQNLPPCKGLGLTKSTPKFEKKCQIRHQGSETLSLS